MPVTIETVKQHLTSFEIEFDVDPETPDEIGVFMITDNYRNIANGEKTAVIMVSVAAEGQILQVYAPMVERLTDCRFKGATLAAMAEIAFRTRHAQMEYDPTDHEVRVTTDIPVMDGTVTARQVVRLISNVVFVLDTFQPVLRHAMETGKVDMSLAWKEKKENAS